MLPIKFTSKLLQLPLNKLKIIEYEDSDEEDILRLKVKRRTKYCKCPYCGRKTKKRYDNSEYTQTGIKHYTTFKWNLELSVIKRRFFCNKCNRSFQEQYEFIPYNIGKDRRVRSKYHTKTFEEYVLYEWTENTVAEIGRRTKVSEYRLWGIIGELDIGTLERKGVQHLENTEGELLLGIDEHSFKGHDYVVIITEHTTKKVVAVLKSPNKQVVKAWFENLPESVKKRIIAITMDMTNNFKGATKESLGEMTVYVVDKFHLIQGANKVIDEVRKMNQWMIQMGFYDGSDYVDLKQKKGIKRRKKKQKNLHKFRTDEEIQKLQEEEKRLYRPSDNEYKGITEEHYLDKKYRTLPLLGEEKLSYRQKHRLNQIFIEFDPKGYLFEIYNAKEKLRSALENKDQNELDEMLEDLKDTEHYKIKEFRNMIENHYEGILNYFKYEITNARVEGKNNKAKVFKRIAFGYNNKENYRKKLLFAL